MSDLRSVIQDHWEALQRSDLRSGWLTSELPVLVSGSPLLCAIGPDGNRHLLTPIASNDHLEPDLKAEAVQVVRLTLDSANGPVDFADLRLARPDLAEVFTGLCSDIVSAMAITTDPLTTLSQVVEAWRELFRSGTRLSVEKMAGLFGELLVLKEFVARGGNLLGTWRGPLRSPQDFVRGPWAIEVKATAASEGTSVSIHGVDQLEAAPDGGLMLWWMRLDTSSAVGSSLPDLVEDLRGRVARPVEFLRLLAHAGYYVGDATSYEGVRFNVSAEGRYLVTDEFPRIVASKLNSLHGIANVRYSLDLASCPPPMSRDAVTQFIDAMVR